VIWLVSITIGLRKDVPFAAKVAEIDCKVAAAVGAFEERAARG
jgi:hypothetical protein